MTWSKPGSRERIARALMGSHGLYKAYTYTKERYCLHAERGSFRRGNKEMRHCFRPIARGRDPVSFAMKDSEAL